MLTLTLTWGLILDNAVFVALYLLSELRLQLGFSLVVTSVMVQNLDGLRLRVRLRVRYKVTVRISDRDRVRTTAGRSLGPGRPLATTGCPTFGPKDTVSSL